MRLLRALVCLVGLPPLAEAVDPAVIARGRYLTHDVAMCVECHTPRDAEGALIADRKFMGAPFPVAAPAFIRSEDWCVKTPRIAGLPGFEREEAIAFLMNGARSPRHESRWPMPPFHLTRPDAEAVVSYLMSLGPRPAGGPP